MAKTYIGAANVAKSAKKIYIGVDGVARKVKSAYMGVNGVARLAYMAKKLEDYTWQEIKQISQSGTAQNFFALHDTKNITLTTGEVITVEIVDFNHDVDQNGKLIGITFIMTDLLATKYYMNSGYTNTTGWSGCNFRNTSIPAILATFPADLRGVITAAKKSTSAGAKSATIVATIDNIWIPSEFEMFGSTTYTYPGEGTHYAAFNSNTSRRKQTTMDMNYQTRSPYKADNLKWCYINTMGTAGTRACDSTSTAFYALGFCI